ncbi:MAG TPA: response regulator [Stellaceae bacterium]|nr:response regulator [Stellaceae bacterium]
MEAREHILVVDDDPDICDLIREYLSGEGYRISTVNDGEAMRGLLERDPVALVILDLVLPGEDGLALARVLREHWDVGIIFLTGRGEIVDRIIGLEMGADDYLAKPFNLRELLARVRSVLRRVGQAGGAAGSGDHGGDGPVKARFAGWKLDLAARELLSPSGEQVRLTTGEFDLLVAFVRNANRVLSRDRLMVLARHREAGPLDRTIDVQVGRLRRKLEPDPDNPVLIKTVRGTGYIFTPTVEPV